MNAKGGGSGGGGGGEGWKTGTGGLTRLDGGGRSIFLSNRLARDLMSLLIAGDEAGAQGPTAGARTGVLVAEADLNGQQKRVAEQDSIETVAAKEASERSLKGRHSSSLLLYPIK